LVAKLPSGVTWGGMRETDASVPVETTNIQ
jgi:hypothetical protein